MDMYDFFFPEQAEAAHLRRISRTLARSTASAGARTIQNADELADLRTDVRFLSLVVAAILKRLAEQQTMSLGDVSDLLQDIDHLDGLPDGGLDPGVLRGILGVIKQEPDEQQPEIKIVTTPRYRNR